MNSNSQTRWIRILSGLLFVFLAWLTKVSVLFPIGILIAAQGFLGWCVWYQAMGKNECKTKQDQTKQPWYVHPFVQAWWLGLQILLVAVVLNAIAKSLAITTWYELLTADNPTLDLASVLFLFLAYPIALVYPVVWKSK